MTVDNHLTITNKLGQVEFSRLWCGLDGVYVVWQAIGFDYPYGEILKQKVTAVQLSHAYNALVHEYVSLLGKHTADNTYMIALDFVRLADIMSSIREAANLMMFNNDFTATLYTG